MQATANNKTVEVFSYGDTSSAPPIFYGTLLLRGVISLTTGSIVPVTLTGQFLVFQDNAPIYATGARISYALHLDKLSSNAANSHFENQAAAVDDVIKVLTDKGYKL